MYGNITIKPFVQLIKKKKERKNKAEMGRE
jgi:hypothetical protein